MTAGVLVHRRRWSTLAVVEPEELLGDLEASFVRPLVRLAPLGLATVGLRRWFGKRFTSTNGTVTGLNLVRRGDRLVETMPMSVTVGISLADGATALVLQYPPDGRRPWRWVRDELRRGSDGTIVGMTFLDLPGLRSLGGLPFLLSRPAS